MKVLEDTERGKSVRWQDETNQRGKENLQGI